MDENSSESIGNELSSIENPFKDDSSLNNSDNNNKFNSLLNDFAKIFNYENYNEDFIKYLKSIEIPNTQVCSKIFDDYYTVQCSSCDKTGYTCICFDCYKETKNLHENHNIKFVISNGFCDCGHIENWPKEKFCSKHKGVFSSLNEINDYIKKSFSDDIVNKINIVLDEIFSFIIEIAIKNEIDRDYFFNDLFTDFINFLSELTENNLGLLHIIATHLSKNYSNDLKVKHKCIKIDQNNNCNIIPSNENEEHNCICSAIKIILTSWTEQKYDIFLSFKVNYKISEEIGLTYLFIFNELLKKPIQQNLNISYAFCELEYIKEFIKDEKNYLCFLDYLYEEGIKLNNKEIKLNLFSEKLKKIYILFKEISKPFAGKPFYTNILFFKKIIDLLDLFHNYNIISYEQNENEVIINNKYEENYLNLELNLLNLLSFFVQILIEEEKFNTILEYIISKIITNYEKKNIKENEFSIHIILIRGFGILLNKYCFFLSIKKNIDLFQSFLIINSIINSYCKSSYLYEIIIKQLFKLLGFIISIKYNFFIKYDLYNYYYDYFNYYMFYLNDQVIFKYMISLKENKKFFTIKNIIQMTSIHNSNKNFIEKILNDENFSNSDLNWFDETEKNKNFQLIKQILEIFYKVVRCNNCLIDLLGYNYSNILYYKIKDSMTLKILEKEEENIKNLVKENFSNRIIKNNNLINYNEGIFGIFNYVKDFLNENVIQEIFSEITNKIKKLNEQMLYSLKIEYLKKYDISYIYSPYSYNQAEKYFLTFKNNDFNILNTYFIPFISIEEILGKNGFLNFFFNEDNYNFVFKFTTIMYLKKEFFIFHNYFVNIFLRIILSINILKNDSYISQKINKKNIEENIFNFYKILQNNKIEDNFIINLNNFVISEINKYSNNLILNNNNKLNSNNELTLKNNKNDKKNKLKEKFKLKSQNAKEKFLTKENINLLNEENNNNNLHDFNEENCIICHKSLQNENKLYGKIYYIIHDNLFSINIKNNINNEINKNKLNNLIDINNENNDYDLSIRLTTCQHNFHYECNKNLDSDNLICPFCKKHGNYFVPSAQNILNLIENNQYFEFDHINFLNKILITDDLFEMYKNFIIYFNEFIYNFESIELQNFYIEFWNLIFIFLKYEIKNLKIKNSMFKIEEKIFSKEINSTLIENLLYNEIFDINYTKNSIINEYSLYYYFIYFIKKSIIKEKNSISKTIQNLKFINFIKLNEINEKCFERLFKILCIFDLIVNNYNNTLFYNEHKINFDLLYENFGFNKLKNYSIKKIILNENNILNIENYEQNYNYEKIVNFINNKNKILDELKINSFSFKKELILIDINMKYNFILLPNKLQDLILNYYDKNCFFCKENVIDSVICLNCGKKMCYQHINSTDKFLIDMHYKKCIFDNGAFIRLKTGSIFYLMNYKIKNPFYDVYLNKLGEYLFDVTCITNDYVINNKELKKIENKFFNLDFL